MRVTPAIGDAGVLFESYRDPIRRYILRIIRDSAEADDLTQETFLRVYERGDSLRDPHAIVGWLYRIATNVCVDRLRSRRPEVSLDGTEESHAYSPSSTTPSVVDMAERQETSRCVQRCLEYLPESYRAVLLLYEGNSLTAAEIATLLGLKLTTVKMRLHRAHNLLREVMHCGCFVETDQKGLPVCQPKDRARKYRV
jgi:RNA polymerase sigma-70 factor, ECF subfamily